MDSNAGGDHIRRQQYIRETKEDTYQIAMNY